MLVQLPTFRYIIDSRNDPAPPTIGVLLPRLLRSISAGDQSLQVFLSSQLTLHTTSKHSHVTSLIYREL